MKVGLKLAPQHVSIEDLHHVWRVADALRPTEEMAGLGFADVIYTVKVTDGRRLADQVAEKILPRVRSL